jgi:ATP-dependent Clp protease adaptor protein ClpS
MERGLWSCRPAALDSPLRRLIYPRGRKFGPSARQSNPFARGDGKQMSHPIQDEQSGLGLSVEDDVREPRQFKVMLHNDDYTTMEFVVLVLVNVFRKTEDEATKIMLNVHQNGVGVCGVYTAEVAELKVSLVHRLAKENGYPLRCSMEEV